MKSSAEPTFFGPEDRRLFGWLHRPVSGASSSRVGVVICNPFGYEAVCAHRTIRHLSEHLARDGFPVLRFDYDGTGDSVGTEFDADRVPAWLRSADDAAEFLCASTGATHICFAGLRLGAMIAIHIASTRANAVAALMIAPSHSMKTYLRELRAFEMAIPRDLDARKELGTADDGCDEYAGFLMSAQTRDALVQLDHDEVGRGKSVLLLDRNDVPSTTKLRAKLEEAGANVECGTFDDYAQMMQVNYPSSLPESIALHTSTWLRGVESKIESAMQGATVASTPPSSGSILLKAGDRTNSGQVLIKESAICFGSHNELFGVIAEPHDVPASGTGILLINAGAVHHIGPNRLYVEMARRWAASGHTVLRFDLSGIGDSNPRDGYPFGMIYGPNAIADIELALRELQSRKLSSYVATGVCSGAYHALKMALRLPITCVIPINPLIFFWKEGISLEVGDFRVLSETTRYKRSALRAESWRKLVTGKVEIRKIIGDLNRRARLAIRSKWRDVARTLRLALANDLGRELCTIAKAGTKVHFIFSAGDPGRELLRIEGGSVLPRLLKTGQLEVSLIEGADHTFTERSTRAQLANRLSSIISGIPSGPASSTYADVDTWQN
jgi:pimeloyl-ACP methyl ester carboxylesterase